MAQWLLRRRGRGLTSIRPRATIRPQAPRCPRSPIPVVELNPRDYAAPRPSGPERAAPAITETRTALGMRTGGLERQPPVSLAGWRGLRTISYSRSSGPAAARLYIQYSGPA